MGARPELTSLLPPLTSFSPHSLLNALLDESAVLPTSGSRWCTAAVVELSFNGDLEHPPAGTVTVPVSKGTVEFIKPQDWEAELKLLVTECSTHEDQTIYARIPDPQAAPDARAAWDKIDQVYGRGTMERYRGQPQARVWQRLMQDRRVLNLLTPTDGNEYNSISVQKGLVDADKANALVGGFDKLSLRMRRNLKKVGPVVPPEDQRLRLPHGHRRWTAIVAPHPLRQVAGPVERFVDRRLLGRPSGGARRQRRAGAGRGTLLACNIATTFGSSPQSSGPSTTGPRRSSWASKSSVVS